MRPIYTAILAALAVFGFVLAVQAQGSYHVPRTSWGDPDLEGKWPSTRLIGVPLQRA